MSIQGPCTEDLVISPKPGYKIAGSDISMQDAKLWRNIEKTPEKHTYQIVNAYSSQEFVHIDGTVTKPAPGSGGKGEPPPFHVTVPAIDIDWEDYTAWSDETLEDTRTLWVTDQTNQTFYVNPPREIDDDMPNFTNDKEDEDWIPYLRLHWNAAKINVYTNDVMIQPDFTIPRRHWLDSGNSEAMEFKASRNTNSIPTDEVLDIRLDRMSTTGDVTSGPGGTSGTYDVIKCKTLLVDLDIDTTNAVGTGAPGRTQWEDDNEETIGKFIHMNDMDMDGDFIPDFLDGFGGILDDDDVTGEDAVVVQGDSFVQLILECKPRPSEAKIKFVYDCPQNPGLLGNLPLVTAAQAGTNAVTVKPLRVCIRIWTKPCGAARDPRSVEEGGDFVPPAILLSQEKFVWSGNKATLYVEGIGTTGAGLPKIEALVYPDGGDGEAFWDKVAYSVARCVYRVCVYRPYTYHGETAGVPDRRVFRTEYTTPRTMLLSYLNGIQYRDFKFHEECAFMGHGFAKLEARAKSLEFNEWTGQTGMSKGDFITESVLTAIRQGVIFWTTFSGHENTQAELEKYWDDFFITPISDSILNDKAIPRKMVATVEYRVLPNTMMLLREYQAAKHNFANYGLDTTIKPSTLAGCGSYVKLLTEYAGLTDSTSWVTDEMMPLIELPSIPSTWAGLLYLGVEATLASAKADILDNPISGAWGSGSNPRSLRMVDPCKIMDWIDDENSAPPVALPNHTKLRVKLYNTVPSKGDLNEWRR